jgi:hypothetical protein
MARATLNWTLPTTRVDGAALAQGDIDFTDISMSADGGANFSPPIQVPADAAQTFVVDDLVGGTYIFRAVVQDMQGRRSAWAYWRALVLQWWLLRRGIARFIEGAGMMMATSNGVDLFNGWPEDGEPVELGEPDVIRNEDNILWLRAQIASLAAAVNTMHKEAIEQEKHIAKLEKVVEHCAVVRMCSKCADALEDSDE